MCRRKLIKEITQVENKINQQTIELENCVNNLVTKVKHQVVLALLIAAAAMLINLVNYKFQLQRPSFKKTKWLKRLAIRGGLFILKFI